MTKPKPKPKPKQFSNNDFVLKQKHSLCLGVLEYVSLMMIGLVYQKLFTEPSGYCCPLTDTVQIL